MRRENYIYMQSKEEKQYYGKLNVSYLGSTVKSLEKGDSIINFKNKVWVDILLWENMKIGLILDYFEHHTHHMDTAKCRKCLCWTFDMGVGYLSNCLLSDMSISRAKGVEWGQVYWQVCPTKEEKNRPLISAVCMDIKWVEVPTLGIAGIHLQFSLLYDIKEDQTLK